MHTVYAQVVELADTLMVRIGEAKRTWYDHN